MIRTPFYLSKAEIVEILKWAALAQVMAKARIDNELENDLLKLLEEFDGDA